MDSLRFTLERRLSDLGGIPPERTSHIANEILDLFSRTVDDFIASRHQELQREGNSSESIYRQIQTDLKQWRFKAPTLSLRQIRRRIYG